MAQRNRRRMMPSPLHPISAETAQLDNAVIGDYGPTFELEAQCRFDELRGRFEQRLRERDQLFGR